VLIKVKQLALVICLFLFLLVVLGGGLHLNPAGAFLAASTGTPLAIHAFNRWRDSSAAQGQRTPQKFLLRRVALLEWTPNLVVALRGATPYEGDRFGAALIGDPKQAARPRFCNRCSGREAASKYYQPAWPVRAAATFSFGSVETSPPRKSHRPGRAYAIPRSRPRGRMLVPALCRKFKRCSQVFESI